MSYDIEDYIPIAGFAIGVSCLILMVFVFGVVYGETCVRREAIAAGLAEYRPVNPAQRKTEFAWKARDNKDAPERP